MNDKRVKLACYMTNLSVSVVTSMSAILFMIFKDKYGISFTKLGTLVLINFFTQLLMDLVFTFFSHKFSVTKSIRITPILNICGFLIYGAIPMGLCTGVFSRYCSAFLAIFVLPLQCTLVQNDTHYAPVLCTEFLCIIQKSGGSVLLSAI